jgi:RND family efflux transporter MFP subunit
VNACGPLNAVLIGLCVLIQPTISYAEAITGVVEFRNVVKLNAAVSGLVSHLYGGAGGSFKKGEVIVTQDQGPFLTRLHQATISHNLLTQKFAEAEAKFEREEILFDEGSMSLVDFERAKISVEESRARLVNAESSLKSARYQHGLSKRVAPFDGIIVDVSRQPGEFINASVDAPPLMTIAERGAYRVVVDSQADAVLGYKLGMTVNVSAGANNWSGRLGAIRYPVKHVSETSGISLEIHFDADMESIIPGQSVMIELP